MTAKDFNNRVKELVHPFFLDVKSNFCNENRLYYNKQNKEIYSVNSLVSLEIGHNLVYHKVDKANNLWDSVHLSSFVSYIEPGKSSPIHSNLSISNVIYRVTPKGKIKINTASLYIFLCIHQMFENFYGSIDNLKLELI